MTPADGDVLHVEMANIATKPLPRDDGLVTRLSISTNTQHKPDLFAAISGTIVCPRAQKVWYYQGIVGNIQTIKTTRTLVASNARNVSVMN